MTILWHNAVLHRPLQLSARRTIISTIFYPSPSLSQTKALSFLRWLARKVIDFLGVPFEKHVFPPWLKGARFSQSRRRKCDDIIARDNLMKCDEIATGYVCCMSNCAVVNDSGSFQRGSIIFQFRGSGDSIICFLFSLFHFWGARGTRECMFKTSGSLSLQNMVRNW